MEIVQFTGDRYAIRKRTFWTRRYLFLDLVTGNDLWWPRESRHFGDCVSTDFGAVRQRLLDRYDYGRPIQ